MTQSFPVTPNPDRILLIDTSRWQNDPTTAKNVDYAKMKAKGCSGVIMKVGQGLGTDRDWKVNSKNANDAFLPVGGYWYYDNRVEPKRQAEAMAEALKGVTVQLGLWLDLEDRTEGVYKGWKNWYVFLEKLKELVPSQKIGIYTGYYYWVERTAGSGIPKGSLDYFKKYPLWIAAYNNTAPLIPAPWKDYAIWQFTDLLDGIAYGAESKELDGNYFSSALVFEEFFGLTPVVKPPVDTQPTPALMVGMQEYILSLGGSLDEIRLIEISSFGDKNKEMIELMNYALELDRKAQGG